MRERTLGIGELPEAISVLPSRIEEAAGEALDMEEMVGIARSLCPVDTGALAGSIRVERLSPLEMALTAGGAGFVNPRTGRVIDYAEAVHDGTSKRPARPFLRQALMIESPRLASEMLEGVEP